MDAEQLFQILKEPQAKQGYYFNPDKDFTLAVLKGVLRNKERYGYASCPCRLATGDPQKDRPIICPCTFRPKDVEEYGRCFCGLYLSKEATEERPGTVPPVVPDKWLRGFDVESGS